MKRITYNDLPTAVAELLEKMNSLEKLIREIKEIKGERKSKVKKHDEPSMVIGDGSDLMLDIEEASRFTGISKTNLYSYVKNKKIPFIKEKNGRLRFSRSELIIWAKEFNRSGRKSATKGKNKQPRESNISQPQDPDHITLREIVKLVGKHPSAVYYLLRKKNIPVVAKTGNRVYYSRNSVMDAFKDEIINSTAK